MAGGHQSSSGAMLLYLSVGCMSRNHGLLSNVINRHQRFVLMRTSYCSKGLCWCAEVSAAAVSGQDALGNPECLTVLLCSSGPDGLAVCKPLKQSHAMMLIPLCTTSLNVIDHLDESCSNIYTLKFVTVW